jgi:hypothetical protein
MKTIKSALEAHYQRHITALKCWTEFESDDEFGSDYESEIESNPIADTEYYAKVVFGDVLGKE